MAKIPVEEKKRGGWIWWLLGLLVLVGLVWWWAADGGEEEIEPLPEEEIVEPAEPQPGVAEDTMAATVSAILANPQQYIGETFPDATVPVAAVPTDRGFWIAGETDSLLAVIIDIPEEEPKDINAGQSLQITDGTLRDPTFLSELPGVPLDEDTRRIAEGEPIFLVVDERNISIQGGGMP